MVKRGDDDSSSEHKKNPTISLSGTKGHLFAAGTKRLWYAALVSIFLHAMILVLLPLLIEEDPKNSKAEALRVWFTEKPPAIKQDSIEQVNRPVVELTPSPKIRPKEAHYLGEFDQSTDEERRAPALNDVDKKSSNDSQPESKNAQKLEPPREPIDHELGRPIKKLKSVDKNDPLSLRPNFPHEGFTKRRGTSDHLPDVKEGEQTELNAWQWRHAPFFNRVKARIGQIWSPQAQIARFDPNGVLLGQKDRVTVLLVTIDRKGFLRDLKITDQSGVNYLDEEAERTFREASPFLFPPQELFSNKDEFSFTFAFHLYINRGFSFGFDWQND